MPLPLPELTIVQAGNLGEVRWPLSFASLDSSSASTFQTLIDANLLDDVLASAATYLWHWTGRRFGISDLSLEICLEQETCTPGSALYVSSRGVAPWFSPYGGCCAPRCDCRGDCSFLRLPGRIHQALRVAVRYPDESVEEIPLEGLQIVNNRWIQRKDGTCWPRCGEGTILVTYERGTPLPPGGQLAAALLAIEMGKAVMRDSSCKLPQRVQSITRQGVSMTMFDEQSDLDGGRVGIFLIDSWINSVMSTPRPGRVFVPGRKYPGGYREVRPAQIEVTE